MATIVVAELTVGAVGVEVGEVIDSIDGGDAMAGGNVLYVVVGVVNRMQPKKAAYIKCGGENEDIDSVNGSQYEYKCGAMIEWLTKPSNEKFNNFSSPIVLFFFLGKI
ncbi:hypothetical protein F0562_017885 [Nyssa sinensis]|uniref:Uncharacterized protein n=1 Tax=Nyssa sinensis TaxID=561372 RepID=A0A5J4ZAM3_9ASTE|nr:hypothetical protein F0562_017885 [Nyssa sinensis]